MTSTPPKLTHKKNPFSPKTKDLSKTLFWAPKVASPLKRPPVLGLQQAGSLNLPLPKAVFWEVLFMLAVDFGFLGQDVGPVSAHFLRAQRANRMYSRIGIDPLMAKESQSLCRCVCSFAEKYQAVASWLTELPSCTKGHFHCSIVWNITPWWGKVGRKRGQCHWEVGDCLEFEDDFYMATCHKYIVPAFAHHCAHDSIAHASISKDVLYVGGCPKVYAPYLHQCGKGH